MAARDSRRKPGMTVGQRMRDFSRSVMRHYAPLPDDSTTAQAPVPSAPSRPDVAPMAETPEINTQFVTSAPLPFDTPATEPAAPLLPSVELPVYAPDPPLPQYVVPSTPASAVQRTEQPAQPSGDIAMGPDGRPLLHNGKPIPVDHDPTPPALLDLMQRQRQRDAEVQRLKEERTEKLKAELPPAPEDGDAPRSSRIRRRGSADVDYIQTKALADKREPGDNGAPPVKNNKSARESEQQEAQSLDDDEESNGDGVGSTPFETPTDAAVPVAQPADNSTASDLPAIQREPDFEKSLPTIPFDTPVDAPSAEPAVIPEVSEPGLPSAAPLPSTPTDAPLALPVAIQREPNTESPNASQPSREVSKSTPTERQLSPDVQHPAAAPQASAPVVQRQADTNPSAPLPPLDEAGAARDDRRSAAFPSTPDAPQVRQSEAAQTPPLAVQRQAAPEITPSLPFDTSTDQPDLPVESQTPVVPAPEVPPIQHDFDREIPVPSQPFVAPAVEQPVSPELANSVNNAAPEAPLPLATAQQPSMALQRQEEVNPFTPNLPFDVPPVEEASFTAFDPSQAAALPDSAPLPVSNEPQAPVQPIQRRIDHETPSSPAPEVTASKPSAPEIGLPSMTETAEPKHTAVPERAQPTVDSPTPAVQRRPAADAVETDTLPFGAPHVTPAAQQELPQAAQPVVQPEAPAIDAPSSTPVAPVVQRQHEAEISSPDSLPFDAPPVTPAAQQELPQAAQPTVQQDAPSIDTPSAPAAPVVQRQTDATASDALPFDVPPVTPAAQPELQQSAQPAIQQDAPAIDAPSAQAALTVQRQTEASATDAPPTPVVQRQIETASVSPDALPFDTPSIGQAKPSDGLQRQLDASPVQETAALTTQRDAEIEAPTSSATPIDAAPVMRVPLPEAPRPAENAVPTANQDAAPTIQRQLEVDTPALSALPFDAPLDTKEASLDVAQEANVQTESLPTASPTVQRQVETDIPASNALPFDAQSLVQEIPSEGTQPQTGVSPAQPPLSPAIQRQPDDESPIRSELPFDETVAEGSNGSQPAAPEPSPLAPAIHHEAATDIAIPQSGAPAPVVQRQSENESAPQELPLTAPQARQAVTPDTPQAGQIDAPEQTATPSTPASAVQRTEAASPAAPLPFDISQSVQPETPQFEQPAVSDDSSPAPAALQRQAQPAMPSASVPDVQRQIAPELSTAPLPFDVPPVEQSAVPQMQPSATQYTAGAEQDSALQTSAPSTIPTVQRQVAPDINASPIPFDAPEDTQTAEQMSVPQVAHPLSQSDRPSAAQRQADFAAPTPTSGPAAATAVPAALPFDDLDAVAIQRTPVQQVGQGIQSAILPFDPVTPQESPAIQRSLADEPADPFSTPSAMPASAPSESRMDVFQALVAAGMVSRPPGASTMPAASQPLMQRSPSRESYLANMAQRQESAGSVSGPIQRALSEETQSNPPAPETENDEAPEIDVNQLASDVMRMLRGKLRSEHERLSKR